jgi:hypothetical protein
MTAGRCRDPGVESDQAVFRARKPPDDVEQFFFGQADQRPAQQRAERERVAAIGQGAGQRDQVLDFLAAEQTLAGLGRHGMPRRSRASS